MFYHLGDIPGSKRLIILRLCKHTIHGLYLGDVPGFQWVVIRAVHKISTPYQYV